MVIFFEWHRTAMDQTSRSGLPMTGEDTGLEALASPLAGYLGKVQERAASLEYCPWCTSKGLTYALRSYRINLQESITLCPNPQCLFPLVSRPLEDVLASLKPVEHSVGHKRKNALAMEKEEVMKPACKRMRSCEPDSCEPPSLTDMLVSQTQQGAVHVVSNGKYAEPKTDRGNVNGYHSNLPVEETRGWDSAQLEEDVLDKKQEDAAGTTGSASTACTMSAGNLQSSSDTLMTADGDEPALSSHCGAVGVSEVEDDFRQVKSSPEMLNKHCSLDSSQSCEIIVHPTEIDAQLSETESMGQKSLAADITTYKDIRGITSEAENVSSAVIAESEELVPVPNQLFWRNSNNLCWLDSLLVALVNCRSLRKCRPKDEPQRSSVWQLMKGYEDACAAIKAHQQPGTDGVVRVPSVVLEKASANLKNLRRSIFKLLQPKLHCKLGQWETPVFALPLLLAMDSWVEPLFMSTFQWEFKCSECKAAMKERVVKTLPTFTNISPDWRPLHAVHLAPCNVCTRKNQIRAMMLESVPPVFGLHFVEGLPDNDVRVYTFTFKGRRYSITTVIQYNQQLKHFVTWICNSEGSWMEYDDLKHPDCQTHPKLPVLAEEIHVVFWEVEEDNEPRACSPSSTFSESPVSKSEMKPGDSRSVADELSDRQLLVLHNDTDIVHALSTSDDGSNPTTVAAVDTSIGSTTLLDTFEGLSHNDIITLTLVELKADSEMQPINDNEQTQDLTVCSENEILERTPDSSSTVIGSEMPRSVPVEPPTASSSSETEDGSSSDPTFVPGARGRRGRGRGTGRGKNTSRPLGKTAALSKAAPRTPSLASSNPATVLAYKPANTAAAVQDQTLPIEMTQQVSPVSSTDTSQLSTRQESPTMPLHQNTRWSFLLSKHPLHNVQRPAAQPASTPVTVKPPPLTHSTPNPVRRQPIPGSLFPKAQLRTEESDGLPPKAAEMYGAFGAKSSSAQDLPLLSPAHFNGKPKMLQPLTSNPQKLQVNPTVVSGTSLPVPGVKGLPVISSSKKNSTRSSKIPPGLSETEALRYRLKKKLKAKKKKLAQLNEILGHQGGANLRPDSTDLGSPNTVTSSTYDGSICDDFLSDLLSPATTASNLSPDSTGFLEMLANGQDGVSQADSAAGTVSQVNMCVNEPNAENFLEDFLSQALAQRPTEMESEALSALDLFV